MLALDMLMLLRGSAPACPTADCRIFLEESGQSKAGNIYVVRGGHAAGWSKDDGISCPLWPAPCVLAG